MRFFFLPVLLFASINAALVKTKSAPCAGPGDVVFALDGSESVSRENFQKMKTFTLTNIDAFDIGASKIQVGGLVFSTAVPNYFKPLDTKAAAKAGITSFKQPRNGTRTDLAITYLRTKLLNSRRTRVGVIITDGESKYPHLTAAEAEKARQQGIYLVAIGIGLGKDGKAELDKIASQPSMVKTIESFKTLEDVTTLKDINGLLCNVITTTTPSPYVPIADDSIVIDPLCEGCIIDNGFGYNAFKEDCSKFVQCYPSVDAMGNQIMTSSVQQCPYSTIWAQEDIACVQSYMTECKYSVCKGKTDGTQLPYLGCRTYWTCDDELPQESCCAAGHHFDKKSSKCVVGVPSDCSGVDCGDSSAPSSRKRTCNFEEDKSDPTKYFQILKVPGSSDIKISQSCAPGTVYDDFDCMCVMDTKGAGNAKKECSALISQGSDGQFYYQDSKALPFGKTESVDLTSGEATFGENAHINLWRLANHEFMESLGVTMEVKLKPYAQKSGSETEQIFINCLHSDTVIDDEDCTASISLQVRKEFGKYTFIGFLATSEDGANVKNRTVSVTIPSNSGYKGYLDVVFAYDGSNFALKADGTERSTSLTGWVQRRQSGFIFGRPMIKNGQIKFLDGSLKEINIYDCIPEAIKDALNVM